MYSIKISSIYIYLHATLTAQTNYKVNMSKQNKQKTKQDNLNNTNDKKAIIWIIIIPMALIILLTQVKIIVEKFHFNECN
jgi:H+/gluconate symporter-like permease